MPKCNKNLLSPLTTADVNVYWFVLFNKVEVFVFKSIKVIGTEGLKLDKFEAVIVYVVDVCIVISIGTVTLFTVFDGKK